MGICLLAVISLVLADTGLVAFVFLPSPPWSLTFPPPPPFSPSPPSPSHLPSPPPPRQGYSIELSLLIVALADIGVLLALVATVVIRAWLANRAAEREATAAAAQVNLS